jgi:hypothetical protein
VISIVVSGELLSGFSIGIGINISHLLFVDDTFIFNGVDPDHLHHLRCLVLCLRSCLGFGG